MSHRSLLLAAAVLPASFFGVSALTQTGALVVAPIAEDVTYSI